MPHPSGALRESEFGPAAIIASSVAIDDVASPFLVEVGSTMIRDEKQLTADLEDVEGVLYGVELGAASP